MAKKKQLKTHIKLKKTIGRNDRIDLPGMGLFDIDAKIDTGAFTSTIHCGNIKVVGPTGQQLLQFVLLDPSHPAYNRKKFTVKDFSKRVIKNSFGQEEERFIISTELVIFGLSYTTEFSLSRRGNLKFPILLGRKFLKQGYVVDVNKRNLSYKRKMKLYENSDTIAQPQALLNKAPGRSSTAQGA